MRTVVATTAAGLTVSNNVRTCAERRLLEVLTREARIRGVPSHRVVHFVRRAAGQMEVTRLTARGDAACSLPCLLCRRRLEVFHVRWCATDWSGPVTDRTAGPSKMTQRQRGGFGVTHRSQSG